MDETPVYVAMLDLQPVPLATRELADALIEQWNVVHAEQINTLRADNCGRLADQLAGSVEEWEHRRWAYSGPGGMAAVWTRLPEHRVIHSRLLSCDVEGRVLHEHEMFSREVWEFETDTYTDRDAVSRVEHRPGMHALTEAQARGTDRDAVEAEFARAKERALNVCGRHPQRRYEP